MNPDENESNENENSNVAPLRSDKNQDSGLVVDDAPDQLAASTQSVSAANVNMQQPESSLQSEEQSKTVWIIVAIIASIIVALMLGGVFLLFVILGFRNNVAQKSSKETLRSDYENTEISKESGSEVNRDNFSNAQFIFEVSNDYGKWQPTKSSNGISGTRSYSLDSSSCVAQYSNGKTGEIRNNEDLMQQLNQGLSDKSSIIERGNEILQFSRSTDDTKKIAVKTTVTDYTGNDGINYTTRVGLIYGSDSSGVVAEACKVGEWSSSQSEFDNIRSRALVMVY